MTTNLDFTPLRYHPLWTPFTSDPDKKFGFERQPHAAHVNMVTLARALAPLLNGDAAWAERLQAVVSEEYPLHLAAALGETRRRKLGLVSWRGEYEEALWRPLYHLMEDLDFTIFWRQSK